MTIAALRALLDAEQPHVPRLPAPPEHPAPMPDTPQTAIRAQIGAPS